MARKNKHQTTLPTFSTRTALSSYRYPYQIKDLQPNWIDNVYERNFSTVVTSLACLGKRIQADRSNFEKLLPEDNGGYTEESIGWTIRMCEDQMLADDFVTLAKRNNDTDWSILIKSSVLPDDPTSTKSLGSVQDKEQIIFTHCAGPNKWSIFLVLTPSKIVESYFIGEWQLDEERIIASKLVKVLDELFKDRRFVFYLRLHVSSFSIDPVLLAYVLAVNLHLRRNYLQLSKSTIDTYKVLILWKEQVFHDKWLGALDVEKIQKRPALFPFLSFKNASEDANARDHLKNIGWALIDVTGDGNCGFYSIALGLENINISTYSPGTSDYHNIKESGKQWEEKIYWMRQELQTQSNNIIAAFPGGTGPVWFMTLMGAPSMEDKKGLSNFHGTDMKQASYFDDSFLDDTTYHMNPHWGSYVVASFFKIRVVLVMRTTSYNKESKKVSFTWATTIYEYHKPLSKEVGAENDNHIRITEFFDAHRVLDKQFKETPTIEILYTTGYQGEKEEDNHFQFLRRVLCDDIEMPQDPSENDTLSLFLSRVPPVTKVNPKIKPSLFADDPIRGQPLIPSQGNIEDLHVKNDLSTALMDNILQQVIPSNLRDDLIIGSSNSFSFFQLFNQKKEADIIRLHHNFRHYSTRRYQFLTLCCMKKHFFVVSLFFDISHNEPFHDVSIYDSLQQCIRKRPPKSHSSDTFLKQVQQFLAKFCATETRHSKRLLTEPDLILQNAKFCRCPQQKNSWDCGLFGIGTLLHLICGHSSIEDAFSQDHIGRLRVALYAAFSSRGKLNWDFMRSFLPNLGPFVVHQPVSNVSTSDTIQQVMKTDDTNMSTAQDKNAGDAYHLTHFFENEHIQPDDNIQRPTDVLVENQSSADAVNLQMTISDHAKKRGYGAIKEEGSKRKKTIYGHAFFDKRYHNKQSKHKTASRMMWNPESAEFFTSVVDPMTNAFTASAPVQNIDEYDDLLLKAAKESPNSWVGCSLGDPGDGEAPAHLSTSIPTIYQQHNQRYCLTYSFASALFYCGFKSEASVLASQAKIFSKMHFDEALTQLRSFMLNLVPVIGQPTIYGKRRKNRGIRRHITWESLFSILLPHPTIVIPVMGDGIISHAFCVVDDLIFDSITSNALKLQIESVEWIFNNTDVAIYQAIRFNRMHFQKGTRDIQPYSRPIKKNW